MRFLDELRKRKEENGIPLIPDIKCFSPKEGDLMRGRDPVRLAGELEKAGACAISVVTEEKEFRGSLRLLKQVCEKVSIPVLRKDFIETEEDLDETVNAGAKAVLLMVSCLGEQRLEKLYHAAIARNLTPFVETHTREELRFALALKAPLIGINNRDITVLEKDDGTVMHASSLLREAKERDSFIVVESSLQNAEEIRLALRSGADAALVGTAILKAADPLQKYREMTRMRGLKICGLMSEADVSACIRTSVDICGFVVEYPVKVRWNLDAERAAFLVRQAKGHALTCAVSGGDAKKILSLAEKLRPDFLQLHYTESLRETQIMAEALKKEGIGLIRSVPSDLKLRAEMFGTESLSEIIRLLDQTAVRGVLLDSRDAANAAGGGDGILQSLEKDRDIKGLKKLLTDPEKMLIAGGGITPDNAKEVIRLLQPDYLDVMTGAEDDSGAKSEEKIRLLLASV